jgi:stearoyl-CoA desaturase (delta-9 desaturase)
LIRLLEALGLAWNVKVPSREKVALRRSYRQTGAAQQQAPELEHG